MAKGKKGRKKKKGKRKQNTLWLSFVTVFVCVLAVSLVVGTVFLLRIGERSQQNTGVQDAGKPAHNGNASGTQDVLTIQKDTGEDMAGSAAHFSDTAEEALTAFEEFLEGKRQVCVEQEASVNYGKNCFLADLLQGITEDMKEKHAGAQGWNDKISRLQYAYLDCGNDGIPELALRFEGMELYSADDDSDLTAVIVYENGNLFCRYEAQSWARSVTDLYYYGYAPGSGSAGAAHMVGEETLLDTAGRPHTLCRWNAFLSGEIAAMTPYYAEKYDISSMYHSVFREMEPVCEGELDYYEIGGEEYFSFSTEGEPGEREKQFVELCRQAGMKFPTTEELEQYKGSILTALELDQNCLERKEPDWKEVDDPAYAEYFR